MPFDFQPATTRSVSAIADQSPPSVVVLGSINMDLVARCPALPVPGQTLMASSFDEIPGGKGANQAVAASRAGGRVTMIGCVGNDAFANRLLVSLRQDGVNVDHVHSVEGPSGAALITVADDGENHIVVVPGANRCLTSATVIAAQETIAAADVLLLQLEIPLECLVQAIQIAKQSGTKVVLDPAPVPKDYPDQLFDVDLICPNQTEAARLTGELIQSREQLKSAAEMLHRRGAGAVAMTLGAAGTFLFDGTDSGVISPFPVDAVDTTAAGDAFSGALAVRWIQTGSLPDAVRFGNAAGALAASREGAQPSLPSLREIQAKLAD